MLRINQYIPVINTTDIKKTHAGILNTSCRDSVSFKGVILRRTASKEEIKELANLFYEAITHNVTPENNKITFMDKLTKFLVTKIGAASASLPNCYTAIAKINGKTAGGFSVHTTKQPQTAHLSFMTLAPEFMHTKSGIETLKKMGLEICKFAQKKDIHYLTFTTNQSNRRINLLLRRFNPQKIKTCIGDATEYKFVIADLKAKIEKLS